MGDRCEKTEISLGEPHPPFDVELSRGRPEGHGVRHGSCGKLLPERADGFFTECECTGGLKSNSVFEPCPHALMPEDPVIRPQEFVAVAAPETISEENYLGAEGYGFSKWQP